MIEQIAKSQKELDEKRAKLSECESVVMNGLPTFLEVGRALLTISNEKLYKLSYPTFQIYCEEKFNLSKKQAYEFISNVKTLDNLSQIGDTLPEKVLNSHQLNTLAKVPVEHQQKVFESAVNSEEKLTANLIQEKASEYIAPKKIILDLGDSIKTNLSDVIYSIEEVNINNRDNYNYHAKDQNGNLVYFINFDSTGYNESSKEQIILLKKADKKLEPALEKTIIPLRSIEPDPVSHQLPDEPKQIDIYEAIEIASSQNTGAGEVRKWIEYTLTLDAEQYDYIKRQVKKELEITINSSKIAIESDLAALSPESWQSSIDFLTALLSKFNPVKSL